VPTPYRLGAGATFDAEAALLLRDVDALDATVQRALARCLADPASPVGGAVPETRLVATAGASGLDLTTSAPVRRLTRGRWLSAIKATTALGFVAVIALCLTAATTAPARLANDAIWSLW
jgi:hypothetical protein